MPTDPPEESPPPNESAPAPLDDPQDRSDASREKLRRLVKEMEQAIEDSEHRRDDATRE
jgi:hypothetical protein